MFFGAVPTDCIQQVFKIMDIDNWTDAYVCCSGSFRLERALSVMYPDLRIHSNDVSVYSAVLGGLATGKPIQTDFVGKLDFVQELMAGKSDTERAAAVMVACEMSRYSRMNNQYNIRHFNYYRDHFSAYVASTVPKLEKLVDTLRIESYFSGDWREHANASIGPQKGVLAFPPFFMGDYEHQFRFVDETIKWDNPSYEIYDPSMLHDITRGLHDKGATYCILTDQLWEDQEPVLKYQAGRKVPHFCYANTERSSYRRKGSRAQPFRYHPVDTDKITAKSEVKIVPVESAKLNFIKDVYLATSIIHSSGFGNYLVFLDEMLVGAIIYDVSPTTRAAYGEHTLYLLSDVTVTGRAKMSKLVAMIAQSRQLVRPLELSMLSRYGRIVTTARSKKPVSMKYRGIFKKLSRREDEEAGGFVIQYGADVVEKTPQEIYQDWWKKYGPQAKR